jgi:rhodanese-related sulfurtransferase
MTAIEATNRGLANVDWAMLSGKPPVPEVDVDTLEGRAPESFLLDVREPQEYAEGHVPGAINLPQSDLASRLKELPRDRPIFVICRSGVRSMRAAQFLKQVGFADVINVQGGTLAWTAAGKAVERGDVGGSQPRVIETEWAHAGAS